MFEVKVTPDNGSRYTVMVAGCDLQTTIKDVTKRVVLGEVQCFTVHTIWETEGV